MYVSDWISDVCSSDLHIRVSAPSDIVIWDIFFFQAEDGIRDIGVTGVQTCALPIFIGIGAGMIAALRQNSIFDYGSMAVAMLGLSVPNFVLGPVLVLLFSLWLYLFPPADRKSVVVGKSGDLGGRRIIKKKQNKERWV